MNTDSRARGCFARMVVYVDMEKPLVSCILINGHKQNVEYESLSTILFHYGRYRHVENSYSFRNSRTTSEKENAMSVLSLELQNTAGDGLEKKDRNFRPWVMAEKNSQVFKETVNGLGIGKTPIGQARGLLDQADPNSAAQQSTDAAGRGRWFSAVAGLLIEPGADLSLRLEGEGLSIRPDSKDAGRDRSGVPLDVGNLDSGKHSAVAFHESTHAKESNSLPSFKILNSSPTNPSGSDKVLRNRGRGAAKKHAKFFYGNNIHFKTSRIQGLYLKDSMEQLVESISALSKSNLGNEIEIELGVEKERANVPEHLNRSKRKLLWEGLRSVIPNHSFPWLIMGDFNAILSLSDKKITIFVGKHCNLFGNFAIITNEEIKRALFNMAPLKAPGSDGFQAHFFQSQ
ncbi:hypothetical protein PVK06_024615 [Gossypium arboreum]|uniref:Uncharacterized protein n=1 Tax=Gossypium arboreum TaxID=29729 RepID=A0ABR0PEA5_GOSAR|nr:hypothetical protein PVK06_024615 [Gossypium arboreum]